MNRTPQSTTPPGRAKVDAIQLFIVGLFMASLFSEPVKGQNLRSDNDYADTRGSRNLSNSGTGGASTASKSDAVEFVSESGAYSARLRALVQYDTGHYFQSESARNHSVANGPDLSSGSNFRRGQIGFQGHLPGDWAYVAIFDFGSGGTSGTETPGHINQLYLEWHGLPNLSLSVGARPPSTGLDDSYSASDQLLLERSAPADLMRNLAGGDGRDSIQVIYARGPTFLSLAYTGDKVQEVAPAFDEQQAIVARAAYSDLVFSKLRLVFSAAATDIFRLPDATPARNSLRPITLSNPPEIDVDDNSSKLVSLSLPDAASVTAFNGESALQFGNFLAQGGVFRYVVNLRNAAIDAHQFSGWYAETSWMLTGQPRTWSGSTASFRGPELMPGKAHLLAGGALELAARYSVLALDDVSGENAGTVPSAIGGTQRVATAGLNWYVNSSVKLSLQLQDVHITRANSLSASSSAAPNLNQEFQTVAIRAQFAL